ncbi:hypothetical protein K505DRAFT_321757 [Melanomma pulvis-pyrius CBS 109.77]|uniref:Uncharacterized protein n=1 Tax=Melanomma pulvis-pyrius CBS 109.77 TaxID=1314802 RepID=A0A6A6XR12_9PLEO|nr:hypothetical protein K505DRAFT_321757 [Melanomma pulvis-pyrius CBS 109.77]
MASNDRGDIQLSAVAAGFTIGFGFLTVWEAIKQTRRNRNPLRSVYIYMIWGEILANITIGVIGWVFLDGIIGPTIPVLFFILFCWTFEIQLLMQIIINRIALIAEHRSTIRRIKWGTVAIITAINIAVFCIWIPAHLQPPTSQLVVDINNVWDKISKVLILLVDAYLNWYFLSTVKKRLVEQHGLVKYQPLVGFNAKLMIVSIAMDAMLIGLMFLKNPVVYIQFHPVTYMVKLNIEMSMASLVVRLARGKSENDMYEFHSSTNPTDHHSHPNRRAAHSAEPKFQFQLSSTANKGAKGHRKMDSDEGLGGIRCRTDLSVVVGSAEREGRARDAEGASERSSNEGRADMFGDEMPLGPLGKNGFKVDEAEVV